MKDFSRFALNHDSVRNSFSVLFFLFLFPFEHGFLFGQSVAVNATGAAPSASALLDVDAAPGNNKGILIPRVSLTSASDVITIASPATSLLVYNTNAAMTLGGIGYWYWDGSKWVALLNNGSVNNQGAWLLTGNAGTTAGTNFIGSADAQDLVFKTNNSEWMRILSAGNIGIGTASPASGYKLDIFGNVILSNVNPEIRLNAGGSWLLGAANTLYIGTGGAASTANAQVTLINTGNVGIGTITPAAKLEVQGAVKIVDGTQGSGKVLTSDAAGLANWQNLNTLLTPPASGQATDATALSTTSTSWIDMASMSVTLTTSGGNLLMSFTTQATNGSPGDFVAFRFTVDGTPVTISTFGNAATQDPPGAGTYYQQNVSATWLATSVAPGVHIVKVQWRVSAGNTAIAPEGGEESDRTLVVVEIK